MSSHGSIPAPYAILSKVLSETLPFPEIAYSSVLMGIPISFAYLACVMFRSYIFILRFSANALLLSKSFTSYLFFQLAHIHIAAPEIISMTAINAFPPAAVCPQRCFHCIDIFRFCRNHAIGRSPKAFQKLA